MNKWNIVKDFYKKKNRNVLCVSVVKNVIKNSKVVNVSVINSLKNGGKNE